MKSICKSSSYAATSARLTNTSSNMQSAFFTESIFACDETKKLKCLIPRIKQKHRFCCIAKAYTHIVNKRKHIKFAYRLNSVASSKLIKLWADMRVGSVQHLHRYKQISARKRSFEKKCTWMRLYISIELSETFFVSEIRLSEKSRSFQKYA